MTLKKQNEVIIQEFEKLLEQIKVEIDIAPSSEIRNRHMFRLRQLSNVLEIIKKYPKDIKSGEDLKNFKGVGKGSVQRINEIIKTGKLKEIKLYQKDEGYANIIKKLMEVHGIGQTKAYELVTNYGVKSVTELKKAIKSGKVKVNNTILTGLKYHDIYKRNIPRKETDTVKKYINSIISKIEPNLKVDFCGSYRRKSTHSNDIDILLTHFNVKTIRDIKSKQNYLIKLVDILKKKKFLIDDLTDKDYKTKYMGYCRIGSNPIRRIDIRYVPFNSYYTALMYFTGSGSFNRKLRRLAESLGYMLNEYGLFKLVGSKKKQVSITSEKDIFKELGLEYLPPDKRI